MVWIPKLFSVFSISEGGASVSIDASCSWVELSASALGAELLAWSVMVASC